MDIETVMGGLATDGWAIFDSSVVHPDVVIENLGYIIMENDVSIDVESRSLVRSSKALPPHTDHHLVEYILWHCHEEDLKGGESILVDGVEVFKRQSQADKDILKSIHLMEHCVFEGDLTQHPMVCLKIVRIYHYTIHSGWLKDYLNCKEMHLTVLLNLLWKLNQKNSNYLKTGAW